MRDIENDKMAGKNTLVVKMGLAWAKNYQHFLILFPLILNFIFSLLIHKNIYFSFFVFAYFLLHLGRVRDAKKYEDFDPELKKVALGTFVLSILFWLSLYL